MKKIHFSMLLLALLFCLNPLFGQAPQGFNYQCIVRDAANAPVTNQTVTLLFSLRNGDPTGPVEYAESHTINTNDFGLINLVVGQGTPSSGTFSAINWAGSSKYLKVFVLNGSVATELGTTQLMSVPYALFSGNGGGAVGPQGPAGPQGPIGLTGPAGAAGPQGAIGLTGPAGAAGPQGSIGLTGPAGAVGPQGPIGLTGPTGAAGPTYNAGTGISIVGNTINNTGDVSNSNELQTISLSGTVLTLSNGGGTVTLPSTGGGDNWGTQTVVTTATFNGQGTTANPLALAQNGAATGEALVWNGTNWVPQVVSGTAGPAGPIGATGPAGPVGATGPAGPAGPTYSAGSGISISGNTISNTGDADNSVSNELQTISLSGTVLTLSNGGGTVTLPSTGGGDNWGTQTVVTTATFNGQGTTANPLSLAQNGAATGEALVWNGSNWVPQVVSGPVGPAGPVGPVGATGPAGPIGLTGPAGATGAAGPAGPIGLTGPAGATGAAGPAGPIGLTGPAGAMGATGPAGPIGLTGPAGATGPQGPIGLTGPAGTYTPGAGISIAGGVIANTGDTDASNDITNASTAAGDVTGTFSNLQIAANAVGTTELANSAVTGAKIAQAGATTGQVLRWNGTTWAPGTAGGLTLPYNGVVNIGPGMGDVFRIENTAAATAIAGVCNTGIGVYGSSTSSYGGYFESNSGTGGFFSAQSGPALVTDAGKVGIGTVNPQSQLTVSSTGGNSDMEVNYFGAGGGGLVAFGSANGTKAAPTAKLADQPLASLNFNGYTSTGFKTGASINAVTTENWTGLALGTKLSFATTANGSTIGLDRMTIDPNGSIGVGTVPQADILFTVGTNTTNKVAAVMGRLNSTGNAVWGVNNGAGTGVLGAANTGPGGAFSSTTGLALETVNGRVGIGTPIVAADVKMQINHGPAPGLLTYAKMLKLHNSNTAVGGNSSIEFSQQGNNSKWLTSASFDPTVAANSTFSLVYAHGNGNPSSPFPLTIQGNGAVGVNTTAIGDYQMKVKHGEFGLNLENAAGEDWEVVTSSSSGNLNLYYNNDFRGSFNSATGLYTTSDRRLKTDIKPFRTALQGLMQLNTTDYVHIDNARTGKRTIGFIAQELNDVFPEVVSHEMAPNRNQDVYMVNYGLMSVITVKAIQEQQVQIEALKKENAETRSALEAIQQKNTDLETRLLRLEAALEKAADKH